MTREFRLLIFFVVWIGMVIAFYLIFPPVPVNKTSKENITNVITFQPDVTREYKVLSGKNQFTDVIKTNNLEFYIDNLGFSRIYAKYSSKIYEMLDRNLEYQPFSFILGSLRNIKTKVDFSNVVMTFDKLSDLKYKSRVVSESFDISLERKIEFVSDYTFDMVIKLKNNSSSKSLFNGFGIIVSGPLGPGADDEHFTYQFLRTGYIENGTGNVVETLTTSIFSGTEKFSFKPSGIFSAVWMENKYAILGIAILSGEFDAEFKSVDKKYGYNKVISLQSKSMVLNPNEEKEFKIRILIAPKKNEILESFGFGFRGLEEGGVLKILHVGIVWLLNFIYSIFGHWGISIIVLTIVVKLLLEPLTIKSAVSMKRLQLIAPKIKEIQEQYKNDPKMANIKIAELYRTYGANPASGCFPILLQIPIFIALYGVLTSFIELKGEGLLWIKDLTRPDTVLYIKELESTLILPASVNLLPIIMTLVSLLQTYLTSSKTSSQQTAIMWILPIVFMIIFWNLPSALVLYWTILSILGVVEQYIVNKTLKY